MKNTLKLSFDPKKVSHDIDIIFDAIDDALLDDDCTFVDEMLEEYADLGDITLRLAFLTITLPDYDLFCNRLKFYQKTKELIDKENISETEKFDLLRGLDVYWI